MCGWRLRMIEAGKHQSLLDVSVQYLGSIALAGKLALLNGLSITDALDDGVPLSLPEAYNNVNVAFYAINNITPATDNITDIYTPATPQGIGYWGIEIDFVVQ